MCRFLPLALLILPATLLPLACGEPPRPVSPVSPPVFAGRVVLDGALAESDEGAVFVCVWNGPNDPMPALCRKYALDDPAFVTEDGRRVLRFALDASHDMGAGIPIGDDPDLEFRYDPDGSVDTKEGVESSWAAARPGSTTIEAVLAPAEAPVGDFGDDVGYAGDEEDE